MAVCMVCAWSDRDPNWPFKVGAQHSTALRHQGSDRRSLSAPTCRCRRPPAHALHMGVIWASCLSHPVAFHTATSVQHAMSKIDLYLICFFIDKHKHDRMILHDIAWWFLREEDLGSVYVLFVYVFHFYRATTGRMVATALFPAEQMVGD